MNENIVILDFNLQNIKDVAEKIKSFRSSNNRFATSYENLLADNYINILAKGKSKYDIERRKFMIRVKVKKAFKDMLHGNMIRSVGDVFEEEDARANDLIARGFVAFIEEIKPKVEAVEQAVKKEPKKEKAIAEKIVKVIKKDKKKVASKK